VQALASERLLDRVLVAVDAGEVGDVGSVQVHAGEADVVGGGRREQRGGHDRAGGHLGGDMRGHLSPCQPTVGLKIVLRPWFGSCRFLGSSRVWFLVCGVGGRSGMV